MGIGRRDFLLCPLFLHKIGFYPPDGILKCMKAVARYRFLRRKYLRVRESGCRVPLLEMKVS